MSRGIDPPWYWKPWLFLYPLLEWRRRPRIVRPDHRSPATSVTAGDITVS